MSQYLRLYQSAVAPADVEEMQRLFADDVAPVFAAATGPSPTSGTSRPVTPDPSLQHLEDLGHRLLAQELAHAHQGLLHVT